MRFYSFHIQDENSVLIDAQDILFMLFQKDFNTLQH